MVIDIKQKICEDIQKMFVKFYQDLINNNVPELLIKRRTKDNLLEKKELFNGTECKIWVLGDKTTKKSAKSIGGCSELIKLVETGKFIKFLIENNKSATLRELYYNSETWDYCSFRNQNESNIIVEHFEVLLKTDREFFNIWPESKGHLIGPITIKEKTRYGYRTVDCQKDVNEGGYVIPFNLNNVELIGSTAKFIIAVETAGMYSRLIENDFDKIYSAIVVELGGQPSRSIRKILRIISLKYKIPVIVFTDNDPWSNRIFASISYGSMKTSHISEYITVPNAIYLGVSSSDVIKYKLPADKLKDVDRKALADLLVDPRFKDNKFWIKEIKLQIELNKKSEQQALAKYGLDYVTDVYLPEKLKELNLL